MPLDPTYVGDPLLGQEVGEFRIVEKMSQGGMGVLYRATDRTGKPAAIKVLLPELADDPAVEARLQAEMKATRAAPHPHIVNVFAVGRLKDGRQYMAMEFLRGRPLSEVLREKGRLSVEDVWQVLDQSTSALEAAHKAGVIHRDLKPGNVFYEMRSGRPHCTLLDFGIAKSASAMNMTAPNAMLGTPGYMAPEQIRGEQITPKTDVYALGALTYELLAGKGPFEGGSFVAVMQRQLTEPPALLREVVPTAPMALESLLDEMLQKDPAKRPTIAQVRGRLPGTNPFDDDGRTRAAGDNPFGSDEATRLPGPNPFGDERTHAFNGNPFAPEVTRASPFEAPEQTQAAGAERTIQESRASLGLPSPSRSKEVPWAQEPMTLPPNAVIATGVDRKFEKLDESEEITAALPEKTMGAGPMPKAEREVLATIADLPIVADPTGAQAARPPPAMFRPAPVESKSEQTPIRTSFIRTLSGEPRWKVVLIALVGGAALMAAVGWALWALNHHGTASKDDTPSVVELPAPPRIGSETPAPPPVQNPPPAPQDEAPPPPTAKSDPTPPVPPPAPKKIGKDDAEKRLKHARAKVKKLPPAKRKPKDAILDKLESKLQHGVSPAEVVRELERLLPGD